MALASLRPLRSRNFALIWSAALVSNLGSWMQTVALGVLVYARTDKPAWAGLVAAAGFVPIGLLAPVGGALADRLDRRKLADRSPPWPRRLFAAVLAVLAGLHHDPPWALVVLSFLGGASGAIGFPAYQAMVPDLVPTEDLLGAVSLSSAQYNLGRVIGPALAGLVLLTDNYAFVFGINALSFGAVRHRPAARPPPEAGPGDRRTCRWSQRIVEGARAARAEPGCRSAIGWIAVVALLASPFIALVPAMAKQFHRAGRGAAWPLDHRAAGHRPGGRCGGRRPGPAGPGHPVRTADHAARRPVRRAGPAVRLRAGPVAAAGPAGLRGGRRRLHLRALGAQHGGPAAGAGGGRGPDPQHLHDGPRTRLSRSVRSSRAGWPTPTASGR